MLVKLRQAYSVLADRSGGGRPLARPDAQDGRFISFLYPHPLRRRPGQKKARGKMDTCVGCGSTFSLLDRPRRQGPPWRPMGVKSTARRLVGWLAWEVHMKSHTWLTSLFVVEGPCLFDLLLYYPSRHSLDRLSTHLCFAAFTSPTSPVIIIVCLTFLTATPTSHTLTWRLG